jgi:benzoate/toluate 1,2-dioxygenase beta subunit
MPVVRKKPIRKTTKTTIGPRKVSPPTRSALGHGGDIVLREVEQFLYRQAELLDAKRWSDYIELFDEDGIYWMPASPEQITGDGVPSIFYEDRNLMTMRMKRISHPHAWSQTPAWGTSHIVSNVMLEKADSRTGDVSVRSRFHMMEFRRDASRHFAGVYHHVLRKTKDGYAIRLQRTDMVNGDAPFDYVLLAWV